MPSHVVNQVGNNWEDSSAYGGKIASTHNFGFWDTTESRRPWLLARSLRKVGYQGRGRYRAFSTKESPFERIPAYGGISYFHGWTTRASDDLRRHNLCIKCMPCFKTMAQSHDIWLMEACRRHGMNAATATSSSTFAALIKKYTISRQSLRCLWRREKFSWMSANLRYHPYLAAQIAASPETACGGDYKVTSNLSCNEFV